MGTLHKLALSLWLLGRDSYSYVTAWERREISSEPAAYRCDERLMGLEVVVKCGTHVYGLSISAGYTCDSPLARRHESLLVLRATHSPLLRTFNRSRCCQPRGLGSAPWLADMASLTELTIHLFAYPTNMALGAATKSGSIP